MRITCLISVVFLLFLTGCTGGFVSQPALPVAGAGSTAFQGTVFGGQQPVAGALVSVYEIGRSGYGTGAVLKATTTSSTDGRGAFSFAANAYTCSSPNAPMYLTATGGNAGSGINASSAMMAGLGPCAAARNQFVSLNEVTTAATVYALAGFMGTTLGAGGNAYVIGGLCFSCAPGVYNQGLVSAMNNTLPQLVRISDGTAVPSGVSGAVTITRESAKIITIANVLAACINSNGATSTTETSTPCGKLFSYTAPIAAGTRPSDTIQAALQMTRIPYQNVAAIYNLASPVAAFGGGLTAVPNDWTVAISYATATMGLGIRGPNAETSSTIDIDAKGRVWFPSTLSGATGLGYFDPASTSFKGPFGGNFIIHPQHVAIDIASSYSGTQSYAWTTDLSTFGVLGLGVDNGSTLFLTPVPTNAFASSGPIAVDSNNAVGFVGVNSVPEMHLFYIPGDRSAIVAESATNVGYKANGLVAGRGITFDGGAQISVGDGSAAIGASCGLRELTGTTAVTDATSSSCNPGGILDLGDQSTLISVVSNTNRLWCRDANGSSCADYGIGLSAPQSIAMDGLYGAWIANSGNASVSSLYVYGPTVTSPIAYLHGPSNGGTMVKPYGIMPDASGNVWVSNAGCTSSQFGNCVPGAFVLSELIGAAPPTITPAALRTLNGPGGAQPTN